METDKKVVNQRKRWKWPVRIVLGALLLLLLLALLLQLHPVQNYVAKVVTKSLSKRIDGDLKIGHVNLSLTKGLVLDDFIVIKSSNDTLIYMDKLGVSLQENLLSLVKNRLSISDVNIDGAIFRMVVEENGSNDVNQLLKAMFPPNEKNGKEGAVFGLDIKSIDLKNVLFYQDNKKSGNRLKIKAQKLNLEIDHLDIANNTLIFSKILIDKPIVEQGKYKEQSDSNTEKIKSPTTTEKIDKPLVVSIREFDVSSGSLEKYNLLHVVKSDNHFNSSNFSLVDLNLNVSDLIYDSSKGFKSHLGNLSFLDKNGFQLNSFGADSILFSDGKIEVENFGLRTNRSRISKNLSIQFDDSNNLKTAFINADLRSTTISMLDIEYFVKGLSKTKFYESNKGLKFNLSGIYTGTLDNLRGRNVNIDAGVVMSMKGDFRIRNISKPSSALLSLHLERLDADVNKVEELFEGLKLPPNFEKLGQISFSGNFDGYFNDFVAYGDLSSAIGNANLDMRLDTKNGVDNALYSGNLELRDFDLGLWSENSDIGKVYLKTNIINGVGLTSKNASADLNGNLESFEFKGYRYTDISLDGKIDENNFVGSVLSQDPNLDFSFQGEISKELNTLIYDFTAEVGQINFQKLNLEKDPLLFSGFIEVKGEGKSINDFTGKLNGSDLFLIKKDTFFEFDSLEIVATPSKQFGKNIEINAPGIEVFFDGLYNLNSLLGDVKSIIKKNYPYHTRKWNVIEKQISDDQNFRFDIDLEHAQILLDLLEVKNVSINQLKAKGNIFSNEEELNVISALPNIEINKQKLYNLNVAFNSKEDKGDLAVKVDSSYYSSRIFKGIDIKTSIDRDSINFVVDASGVLDSFQKVFLKGKLEPEREGYKIRILNNDLNLYGKRWKINADNEIILASNFISIRNASITDGTRLIEIQDIDNKGVFLKVDNIDASIVNKFHRARKFAFGGVLSSEIQIQDVFKKSPYVYGNAIISDFIINGDDYGTISFDITKELNGPVEAMFSIDNPETGQAIKATLAYNIETEQLDSNFKGKKVPLKFLEYLLKGGVSDVEGTIDINAVINGNIGDLQIDGYGQLYGGKVKVIYLGETYYFDDQSVHITHNVIDLTGGELMDSEGNLAVITGGLRHTLFRNFYLFANITGDNIIALNTTKNDNPTYYGLGKGRVSVDFNGAINSVNMFIDATTSAGSELSIPITESQTSAEKSFITFINQDEYFNEDNEKIETLIRLDGISIEMTLNMTPDAKVNLIFDENKGDIIKATGRGNMRIILSRYGDFEIFGNYEIEEGEYLFTFSSFVNKPFLVRRGGTVQWTGDPINATIDIEADYPVRTSVSNFITEYLTTDVLKREAAARTEVNLKMKLGNTLFNPSIDFDFEFPELTGEMRTYTDSKLRLLANNPADFNSQVFGLIVFNTFLPSSAISDLSNGGALESAGINTLSEFVSSQVSMFVTGLLNDALEDNGLISGVDFALELRSNSSLTPTAAAASTNNSILPAEIEVRMNSRFRFLDERLSFGIGGNFVREGYGELQNFIIPDFTLQYALTADGKINLKMYGKYDVDVSISNRKQKYGVGIRYRTEFGNMLEVKNNLSDFLKNELQSDQVGN